MLCVSVSTFLKNDERGHRSNKKWDHMSQYDKVEVMDFLINVLKDHEKSLDALISRAEDVIAEKQSPSETQLNGPPDSPQVKVVLKDWPEFRRRLKDIDLICFDLVKSVFVVSASAGQKIYEFREEIPFDASGDYLKVDNKAGVYRLSIGLDLYSVCAGARSGRDCAYKLDPQYPRGWLSNDLGVHQDFIVCGDIEL